ncbi:histidine kinase [Gracilibacillus sp. YIM 98692]|uniref:sensor histidine kinase n=1 Tax=Gracilibacillus sp. YIM 98692 TaxID=2663532 RepID=UPI0013D678A8|nr:histidine kinase [Gracilibacillus sp. YIM 98692]
MKKIIRKIKWFMQSLSLKSRIAVVLAIGTLIPVLFTVLFAYHSMSTILTNKLHDSVYSNLHQIRLSLENTIDDLNYVSQQIAYSEDILFKLSGYLELEQSYDRTKYYEDIRKELNLITFSNPSIGLSLIYLEENQNYLFNSHGVKQGFQIHNPPLLDGGFQLHNYGPHITNERFKDHYVLSTIRKLDLAINNSIYIYLESSLNLTEDILQTEQVVNQAEYLLLDSSNQIIYSENNDFPVHSRFSSNLQQTNGTHNGYYWFQEKSNKDWSIIALIPIAKYQEEMNQWVIMMGYIAVLFVCVSLIIALLLWKNVYKPLNQFNREIQLMEHSNFHSRVVETRIPEFVSLIHQFRNMRKQISLLIEEIEQKERKKADLEVEKLVHQINPHFLMNTLDTARWLAVAGDRKPLTKLLSSLNKILYYNMGKLGKMSTLKEEIDSMEQYINLQQLRYDFTYKSCVNVSEQILQSEVPRFILQPIVENAIYHGLVDDGTIQLCIITEKRNIKIELKDDGRGIPEEKLHSLINEKPTNQSEQGMGIGLHYVKRILERMYNEKADIQLKSKEGEGTSVTLYIPF